VEGFWGVSGEDLRSRILSILSKRGSLSFEELLAELGWSGDLRVLRRVLADMVREGIIVKEPDYSRRKVVYRIRRTD
jgi:DNA-binding HxlR family transcriptional regulator